MHNARTGNKLFTIYYLLFTIYYLFSYKGHSSFGKPSKPKENSSNMKLSSFFSFLGAILACLGPDSDLDPLIHMNPDSKYLSSCSNCITMLKNQSCGSRSKFTDKVYMYISQMSLNWQRHFNAAKKYNKILMPHSCFRISIQKCMQIVRKLGSLLLFLSWTDSSNMYRFNHTWLALRKQESKCW